VLRSLLERKVPWLVSPGGTVAMDPGVLRAFLRIPRYAHGVRSMEALIEMSQLAARRGYEQAALPPRDQLRLHVDADAFMTLVDRDVLFGESREALAEAIHEHYRAKHGEDREANDAALKPWNEVDEALRESNRRQADDIVRKLLRIGCDFRPVPAGTPTLIEFSPEEIELLAEIEHGRWVDEREAAGWTLGPRDPQSKATPYLVPWEALEDMPGNPKDRDRQAIVNIPQVMASAGFEIYRADLPGESSPRKTE
ncbi:MAG: Ryanodine receptor Ryr, partial [Deltaproteobacteria bacterium]|nr:Ryanodine receptor Ryr [Deltaproteobacteria bacterium]